MNKNFKIFIYIIFSFLLVGCTNIDYEVIINEDFTINEEAKITMKYVDLDSSNFVDYIVSSGLKINNIYKYDYTLDINSDKFILNISTTQDNMESLLKDNLNTTSFLYLNYYVDTDNYLKIISEKTNFKRFKELNPMFYNEEVKLNVKIKSYYKIIDSNADNIDFKNNVFTWSFDKNTTNKFIEIKIDKTSPFIKYETKDYIYYYYKKYKTLVVIILVLVLLSTIPFFIMKNFNKNNQI